MTTSIPLFTVTLGTDAELASKIAAGLQSGAYELIGGVVRDTGSKQIVAWLRQVGHIAPAALPTSVMGPLAFQALIASTSLLTLGVTVIGFALMRKRLDTIAKDIASIKQTLERMERKLDLSLDAKVRTALDLARRAFEMHDPVNRRDHAHQAATMFLEAEHYYRSLLDAEYGEGGWLIAPLLKTLTLARVGAARCYLGLGETAAARSLLSEGYIVLEPYVQRWFDAVVGVRPALVLHPATGISLERLTLLMRYRQHDPALSGTAVFEQLRAELWKSAVQDINQWRQPFPPVLREDPEVTPLDWALHREKITTRFLARLADTCTQIETVYAAVRCIEGYRLELEQIERMGLSPDELDQQCALLSSDSALIVHVPKDSELARHVIV
jgi:hypothetical protein